MQEQDLEAVLELCHQLGYLNANIELLTQNFKMGRDQLGHEFHVMIQTETQNLVAWISLLQRIRLQAPAYLQISALVVEEKLRGQGLGHLLLAFAEERARAAGLSLIGLMSSAPRLKAHEFYQNAGYHRTKESFFFQKEVACK